MVPRAVISARTPFTQLALPSSWVGTMPVSYVRVMRMETTDAGGP